MDRGHKTPMKKEKNKINTEKKNHFHLIFAILNFIGGEILILNLEFEILYGR